MSDKNVVVMVANNLRWLQALARNMPESAQDVSWHVFIEDRIGTKQKQVKRVLEGVTGPLEIYRATDVVDAWQERNGESKFAQEYTMGMNVLAQWFMADKGWDKMLMLDDDVVLRSGFERVFDLETSSFYRSMFANMAPKTFEGASARCEEYWDAWLSEVFGLTSHVSTLNMRVWQDWRKRYFCGGHKLFVRNEFDADEYEYRLQSLFENDTLLYEYWYRHKESKGYAWYMDEIFENLFWRKHANDDLKKEGLVHVIFSRPDKYREWNKAESVPILHIACGQWKPEMYDVLEREGII